MTNWLVDAKTDSLSHVKHLIIKPQFALEPLLKHIGLVDELPEELKNDENIDLLYDRMPDSCIFVYTRPIPLGS